MNPLQNTQQAYNRFLNKSPNDMAQRQARGRPAPLNTSSQVDMSSQGNVSTQGSVSQGSVSQGNVSTQGDVSTAPDSDPFTLKYF